MGLESVDQGEGDVVEIELTCNVDFIPDSTSTSRTQPTSLLTSVVSPLMTMALPLTPEGDRHPTLPPMPVIDIDTMPEVVQFKNSDQELLRFFIIFTPFNQYQRFPLGDFNF